MAATHGYVSEGSSIVLSTAFAVLSSFQLCYFFFVRFILEGFVMRKLYGKLYTELNPTQRRSFVTHNLWLLLKLCLLPMAWPFVVVFVKGVPIADPLFNGSAISCAHFLSVGYMGVIAMFFFELIYRLTISPVSLIHHSAAIILACWQVVDDSTDNNESNDSQFRLLILYGAFEVVFETFPHAAVIYYRCKNQHYLGCSRVWFVAGCFSLVGTTGELTAAAVFMWKNWHQWDLGMKIILPILHFAFMGAQIHGARVAFQMSRGYKKKHIERHRARTAPQVVDEEKNVNITDAETASTTSSWVSEPVPCVPTQG